MCSEGPCHVDGPAANSDTQQYSNKAQLVVLWCSTQVTCTEGDLSCMQA
jgi:hypothetical protein